jgi:putative ATP-dependent endonuclease of the OLD family
VRIAKVHVQGYRCIADLSIEFDDLTALIGSGGVGKSAFLRAIKWFFEGGTLDEDDLHRSAGADEPVSDVLVAVTFSDLNSADQEALGRYASGSNTTLTRSWNLNDGDKLSGTALVFPGFDAVRAGEGAAQKKKLYQELHKEKGEDLHLPEPLTRIADLEVAMESWERENPTRCEPRPEEATHLRGYVGTPLLNDRFAYVFVEATTEASEVVDGGKGSPLSQLLSAIEKMDDATEEQVSAVQDEAQQKLEQLISSSRSAGLKKIAEGITTRVQDYVPGVEVTLSDEVAPLRIPSISVLAQVRDETGHPTNVDKQGHGLQRALVIAVLHELAESLTLQADTAPEAETGSSMMLAIEEPELYQHPLQARALAGTLSRLARPGQGVERSVQVSYSTHSAHFVRPTLFEDLRLCRRNPQGQTNAVAPNHHEVEAALARAGFQDDLGSKVEQTLAASLGEAVFARTVLLCEGKTDAALVEALAEEGGGFEKDGVAVAVCWGKSIIPVAVAILEQLEIPTYVLFDGDKNAKEENKPALASKNRELLTLCGEDPKDFPERAVRDRCSNFAGKLESDLEEIWPDLLQARNAVAQELGMPAKSEEAYRRAVGRVGQPPEFFSDLLGQIRRLVS